MYTSPIRPSAPTGTVDPMLSISSCYLLYISDDGVVEEEGGWGVKEGGCAIYRKCSNMVHMYSVYVPQSQCLMKLLTC